ncbi:MAG: hypothetical protein J7L23_01190 [Candidatus Diapherotrites archaeon]|nr:hypothetical protein [Candidatus Diapherotrites archaeon]
MERDKLASILLLLAALSIAITNNPLEVLRDANLLLLVPGILFGVIATVMDYSKSNFLVKKSAEGSLEYVQVLPNITISGSEQLVQKMASWIYTGISKTMGKAILVVFKLIELGLKAIAALCGLIFIVFPRVELLGLWIVLATIFLLVISKIVALVGFFEHFKGAITRAGVLMFGAWASSVLCLWLLLAGFGIQTSALGLFFIIGLLELLSMTPFTFDGVGVIELVGMGALAVAGVPLAASFMALLLWEASKFTGDYIISKLTTAKNYHMVLDRYR